MIEITTELLIRVLLFIIVFFVTFQAFSKFLKDRGVSIIVGLAVALISVFYVSYNQLSWLMLTYSAGGIAILILTPLVIALFFLYSSNINGVLRKMFWVFYSIMFIMLLQTNKTISSETTTLITTITIIAAITIIILDKTIKNAFNARKNLKRN